MLYNMCVNMCAVWFSIAPYSELRSHSLPIFFLICFRRTAYRWYAVLLFFCLLHALRQKFWPAFIKKQCYFPSLLNICPVISFYKQINPLSASQDVDLLNILLKNDVNLNFSSFDLKIFTLFLLNLIECVWLYFIFVYNETTDKIQKERANEEIYQNFMYFLICCEYYMHNDCL